MSLLVLESIGQHIDTIWKEKLKTLNFPGKFNKLTNSPKTEGSGFSGKIQKSKSKQNHSLQAKE